MAVSGIAKVVVSVATRYLHPLESLVSFLEKFTTDRINQMVCTKDQPSSTSHSNTVHESNARFPEGVNKVVQSVLCAEETVRIIRVAFLRFLGQYSDVTPFPPNVHLVRSFTQQFHAFGMHLHKRLDRQNL